MSYELNIYLEEPSPLTEILARFELAGFYLSPGSTVGESDEVLVQAADGSSVFIYGPNHVASKTHGSIDLQNKSWVVIFGISANSAKIAAIKEIAKGLAQDFNGFVYDSQVDLSAPPKQHRDLGDSEFSFLFCSEPQDFGPASITNLFDQVSETFPKVSPIFVGSYEPLAISYKGEVTQRDRIQRLAAAENYLIARSADSSFVALVCVYSDNDDDPAKCNAVEMQICVSRELTLDSSAIIEFFRRLCELTRCFYGGAIFYRPDDFQSPQEKYKGTRWKICRAGEWNGIPTNNTWLTWFGGRIKGQVERYVDGDSIAIGSALLMILGEQPSRQIELQDRFPKLPDSVLDLDGEFDLFSKS